MKKWTRKLTSAADAKAAFQEAYGHARNAISKDISVVIELFRYEEPRTLAQNKKMHPMLRDLAEQVKWPDKLESEYTWKCIAMQSLHNVDDDAKKEIGPMRFVPDFYGNMFPVCSTSTSDLSKLTFSKLIEILYLIGSAHKVKWSEQSLAVYNIEIAYLKSQGKA